MGLLISGSQLVGAPPSHGTSDSVGPNQSRCLALLSPQCPWGPPCQGPASPPSGAPRVTRCVTALHQGLLMRRGHVSRLTKLSLPGPELPSAEVCPLRPKRVAPPSLGPSQDDTCPPPQRGTQSFPAPWPGPGDGPWAAYVTVPKSPRLAKSCQCAGEPPPPCICSPSPTSTALMSCLLPSNRQPDPRIPPSHSWHHHPL